MRFGFFGLVAALIAGDAMGDMALGTELALKPTDAGVRDRDVIFSTSPAVAALEDQELFVWCSQGVMATRIGADGAILDAQPIAAGFSSCASGERGIVAAGQNSYLVFGETDPLVQGAVIGSDGGVSPVFQIAQTPIRLMDAAWIDGAWSVVWVEGYSLVRAARVSESGVVGTAVTLAAGSTNGADIACSSSNCLVSWADSAGSPLTVHAIRIDSSLNQLGSPITVAAEGGESVGVAALEDRFLVSWAATGQAVHVARVDSMGVVEDVTPVELGVEGSYESLDATSDGTGFAVVWRSGSEIFGVRFSAAGVVLDGEPVFMGHTLDFSENKVAIAGNSSGYFLATERTTLERDIWGARFTSALGEKDGLGFGVWPREDRQTLPALSATTGGYVVAWAEHPMTGIFNIAGASLNLNGEPLDAGLFSLAASPGQKMAPAVACGAGECLLVWQDARNGTFDIYGARVDSSGHLVDSSGFVIASGARDQLWPAVSWDGTQFLVAWEDEQNDDGDISGVYVSSAGVVTSAPFQLLSKPGRQSKPSVNSAGGNSALMWQSSMPDAGLHRMTMDAGGVSGTEQSVAGSDNARDGEQQVAVLDGALWSIWHQISTDTVFATSLNDSDAGWAVVGMGSTPRVSSVGQKLIAVSDQGSLQAWLVGRGDDITAQNGIMVAQGGAELRPQVACAAGRQCLVAWQAPPGARGQEIHVRPVFDDIAPVANGATTQTDEDTPLQIVLVATDADGEPLSFSVSAPTHGTLAGTPPTLEYTPAANFNGDDAFTFTVNDGLVDSNVATVSIHVVPVNDPPVANPQTVSVEQGVATEITLSGSDLEETSLIYAVTSPPTHGTLSGTPPALTYTPSADFVGDDALTFTVHDGHVLSSPAIVTLQVYARDAGMPESADAGSTIDGGSPDAGSETPTPPSGCGCSSAADPLAILALVAAMLRRRRL